MATRKSLADKFYEEDRGIHLPDGCNQPIKSRHTPGPWLAWDEDGDEIDILRDGDGPESDRTIATVRSCREMDSNARLIIAAPDLLHALELLSTMHQSRISNLGPEQCDCDRCQLIRKAISRATGKAEKHV